MVSTGKGRQQNKRLLSQLYESNTDFRIGQNNHGTQFEETANTAGETTTLNNINNSIQINGSQVDLHTIEQNIVIKVCSEVNNVMTMVETKIQNAVLTAIENLVIPRVKIAMKSINASSELEVDSVVLDTDAADFSANEAGLQMTV